MFGLLILLRQFISPFSDCRLLPESRKCLVVSPTADSACFSVTTGTTWHPWTERTGVISSESSTTKKKGEKPETNCCILFNLPD